MNALTRVFVLAGFLNCALAWGHAGSSQTLSIRQREGKVEDLVVADLAGSFVSRDRGRTWHFVCEEAIGTGAGRSAHWWLGADGAWFAGSVDHGLFVSRDGACTFAPVPEFSDTGMTALTGRGNVLFAATGLNGKQNRIMRSTDFGKTWQQRGSAFSELFFSSLAIAPSRPQRIYAGAWWYEPYTSHLFISDDGGDTFTQVSLTTLPVQGPLYVLAVHPNDPDQVIATVTDYANGVSGRLLRSTNGGQSFTQVLEAPAQFSSAVFSDDGKVIHAASGAGIFRGESNGTLFSKLDAPTRNTCVAKDGDRLLVCASQIADGYALGVSNTDGGFSELLRYRNVLGPLQCDPATPVGKTCGDLWPVVQAQFPYDPVDGGAVDAGSDPMKKGGCGCKNDGALGLGLLALAQLIACKAKRRC